MTTGSLGRRLSSLLLSVAVALIGAVVTAAPASAHAELLTSDPAPGAVLANAPSALSLRFSEKVTLVPDGIRLLDSRGDPVPIGQPNVRDSTVVVPLQDLLASDGYVLTWRVVSADSHPINGAVPFAVGDAEPAVAAPASESSSAKSALVGARWTAYLGLVLLLGPVLFVWLCWRDGQYDRLVARLVTVGAGTVVISSGTAVLLQGAYAAGLPAGQAIDTDLLETTLRTTYGQAAVARVVLVLALLTLLALLRRRPSMPADVVASLMTAGVAVTYSLQGHANASSDRLLRLAGDSLHLAAMTCWMGGLVVLASCVLRSPVAPTVLARVLPRWSRVAMTAVAVLAVTGTYQSVREVGSLSALTSSSYGQTLLVKLGLFAVLIALGYAGRNWVGRHRNTHLVHDAEEPNSPAAVGRLRRTVLAETAFGAAVLAVTAVLVATTPGHASGDADVAHHDSPAAAGFSRATLPKGTTSR